LGQAFDRIVAERFAISTPLRLRNDNHVPQVIRLELANCAPDHHPARSAAAHIEGVAGNGERPPDKSCGVEESSRSKRSRVSSHPLGGADNAPLQLRLDHRQGDARSASCSADKAT
jgi:hypothetical protein